MWKLKNVTIINSTIGVIPKHLHQSINTLGLPPYTYALLQKAAILKCKRFPGYLLWDGLHEISPATFKYLYKISFTLYPAYSRVGRGNLVLRDIFFPIFRLILESLRVRKWWKIFMRFLKK